MDKEMNKSKMGKITIYGIIAFSILVVIGGVLGGLAFASGTNVEILDERIHVTTDFEDLQISPAKLRITGMPKEYRIKYEITNYGSETSTMVLYSRFPDEVTDGYKPYLFNEKMYLVFPEKYITIKGGDTYETEVIIGFPDKDIVTHPIELWVGFKSTREQHRLELNSRILLPKED